MRILVTGATGFVGSVVARGLLQKGHTVLGLARSDTAKRQLLEAGVQVLRGALEDEALLRDAAAGVDGVIHTAFNHDFSRFAQNCELDARAIAALGAGLQGTDRPLVVTSGMARLAQGRPATEDDRPPPPSASYLRQSEAAAQRLQVQGVNVRVVRLAPSVHGVGDTHGFVPMLVRLAREKGAAVYVGEGLNRWAAVARQDAGDLFVQVLLHGRAGGTYHGCADVGLSMRDLSHAIGQGLGLPARSVDAAQAADHFGWFAGFASADMPATCIRTRAELGWSPQGPSLMDDLRQTNLYFR
jgi:nucleoside-diphosphate-sugar epimerase